MAEEEKNEEVYLEDALEEQIGKCIAAMNMVEPGSEQHVALSQIVERLYSIRLKYTDMEMKYEDNEATRQHELTMKAIDYEIAELENKRREEEFVKSMAVDAGKIIVDGLLKNVIPACIMGGITSNIIAAEYNDNKFFQGSGFKIATSALGKTFKIG